MYLHEIAIVVRVTMLTVVFVVVVVTEVVLAVGSFRLLEEFIAG